MSVACRRNGSYARLFVKGAPDSVLARCSRVLDPATGSPRKLEDGERAELARKVMAMAGRPLRCLALAYTDDLPPELRAYEGSDEDADLPACLATADDHEKLESDLVLAGVVGIREGVCEGGAVGDDVGIMLGSAEGPLVSDMDISPGVL